MLTTCVIPVVPNRPSSTFYAFFSIIVGVELNLGTGRLLRFSLRFSLRLSLLVSGEVKAFCSGIVARSGIRRKFGAEVLFAEELEKDYEP